jgi:hypothetical protein
MKIIRDTRERNGWDFAFYEGIELDSRKLDSGDYTTELLEDIVVIERKATATELANNLGKRTAKARFYREFERMKPLSKAYIVCEFPESNVYEFPKNSGLPKAQMAKVRITGNYLRKLLNDIRDDFENIEIVFCNSRDEAETFTHDTLTLWEEKIK